MTSDSSYSFGRATEGKLTRYGTFVPYLPYIGASPPRRPRRRLLLAQLLPYPRERLLAHPEALEVLHGTAVARVEVLDGGLDQVGGRAKEAAELLAADAALLRVVQQPLAQGVYPVVREGEVLDYRLRRHARHLEEEEGEEARAVLAGRAVEEGGALALGQECHRLGEGRTRVVEGRQVEGHDVELVGRPVVAVDPAPHLHVVP